jgi:IBR domain, a half RING-finger domain
MPCLTATLLLKKKKKKKLDSLLFAQVEPNAIVDDYRQLDHRLYPMLNQSHVLYYLLTNPLCQTKKTTFFFFFFFFFFLFFPKKKKKKKKKKKSYSLSAAMGNQQTKTSANSKGKKLIKRYWEVTGERDLRESKDNRNVKKFFNFYDKDKDGVLSKAEALAYIRDLLDVSGVQKRFFEEEIPADIRSSPERSEQYYRDYVESIFSEMDSQGTGSIRLEQLVKPNSATLEAFLNAVSTRGQEIRESQKIANRDQDGDDDRFGEDDDDDDEDDARIVQKTWLRMRLASGKWEERIFRLEEKGARSRVVYVRPNTPDVVEASFWVDDIASLHKISQYGAEAPGYAFDILYSLGEQRTAVSVSAPTDEEKSKWLESLGQLKPSLANSDDTIQLKMTDDKKTVEEGNPTTTTSADKGKGKTKSNADNAQNAGGGGERTPAKGKGKSKGNLSADGGGGGEPVRIDRSQVNQDFVAALTECGHSEEVASVALLRTGNKSVDRALAYIKARGGIELEDVRIIGKSYPTPTSAAAAADDASTTPKNSKNPLRRSRGGAHADAGVATDDADDGFGSDGEIGSWEMNSDDDSGDLFDDVFDDDVFGDGLAPIDLHASGGLTKTRQGRSALTSSGIVRARTDKAQRVADTLGVEPYEATAILSSFDWNTDRAIHAYLDKPTETREKVGLVAIGAAVGDSGTKEIECSVCWGEPTTEFTVLTCGHAFCNECWCDHLAAQIKGGESLGISCMQSGCTSLVPEFIVQKIVDKELYEKYASFASKHFVEASSDLRWCPAPGCENAVTDPVPERNCMAGYCSCGHRFCFACNEEAHTPATCAQMKEWIKKCDEDAATLSWIAQNTKVCLMAVKTKEQFFFTNTNVVIGLSKMWHRNSEKCMFIAIQKNVCVCATLNRNRLTFCC